MIDVLNDDLKIVKSVLKSEVHQNGWFHASVHIWFFTDHGELLFQKRSINKRAFPDLWDVSVAGHISTGESKLTSAIREIGEEIGLCVTNDELVYIGFYKEFHKHADDFIDNELHYIYISRLERSIDHVKIQQEELSAVRLVAIDEFIQIRKTPDFDKLYVPHHPEYYDFILDQIALILK